MTRMPYLAVCVAICGSLTLGVPAETLAQASSDRVHSIRRLGTAARFTPAIRDVKAMQTAFARPQTQSDVTTVLKLANLTPIEAQVKKAIADGAVREVAVSPGARFEWMAFRRGGSACRHPAPGALGRPQAVCRLRVRYRVPERDLHLHDSGGLRQPDARAA